MFMALIIPFPFPKFNIQDLLPEQVFLFQDNHLAVFLQRFQVEFLLVAHDTYDAVAAVVLHTAFVERTHIVERGTPQQCGPARIDISRVARFA